MTLAPLTPSRTRGKTLFITFYSFKGGVGRTMSLVNAACILAARGRRVLLIDFDLEAPGLTTLRDLSSKDGPPQQHPGLVELIHDFLRNPKTSALTDQRDKKRFHAEYICPLEIPPHLERIEGGSLDLMPCGRMDETYGQRLNAIKFDQIYEEGIGQPLFKLLKTVIQQSKLYDYVLIDSRTGFSDEGGICTRDLADHIFVIMGLNRQNVDGTVRFLHSLNRSGWQEGRVFFVVSPMPVFYEELRDTRLAEARQQIEATGYKTDLKLYIPYHPRLSLDEEPFVYHWSETNLFDAYQRIQRQIRQLNNDVPSTWWDETIKAIQTSQFEQALHLLKQIKAEDIDLASNLLSVVTEQMVADTPALLQHISAFFDLRLEITGEDAEVLFRYGLSLIENCNYNNAYEILSRSFAISVEQKNRLQMERVRLALGNLMFSQSRLKEAYSYYELALKSFEELEEKEGIAAAQSLLGSIYLVIGKNKQALDYFEMAQGLYDQLKQHVPLAWGHGSIGTAYTALGRYANATHHYNIALTALKELHARSGIARTQMSIGRINFLRGNIELALSMYMEAEATFNELQDHHSIVSVQNKIGEVYQAQGKYTDALEQYQSALQRSTKFSNFIGYHGVLGEIGRVKSLMGDLITGREMIEKANIGFEACGALTMLSEGQVDYAEVLFYGLERQDALIYLNEHWSMIQKHAEAHIKAEARVLRAKIYVALGNPTNAKTDLQAALKFYHDQEVHTALAKEAEELFASLVVS